VNELVWEGLVEILRGNQPSLKATARLWRRDDFFGSDWGGQLELPVAYRRLLPSGEYEIKLPSGRQATARIVPGPATTSMTFPTLAGVGQAPFGELVAPPSDLPQFTTSAGSPAQEIPEVPVETPASSATRKAVPPAAAPQPVAPANTRPVRISRAESAPPVEGRVQPEPESEPAPRPRVALVKSAEVAAPAPAAPAVEAMSAPTMPAQPQPLGQTETLARAYLVALEARQRLSALSRPGFTGRAIEAALAGVTAAGTVIEGTLRGSTGEGAWPAATPEHLSALRWFAALASMDEDPDIAAAGLAAARIAEMAGGLPGVPATDVAPAGRGHARGAHERQARAS
jgi:hypothetical protein